MQAYEFYAIPENGFISIPEQYRGSIGRSVKVILLDDKNYSPAKGKPAARQKSDLLLPPTLDTSGWMFGRDEANER